jgi:hypothetical protein
VYFAVYTAGICGRALACRSESGGGETGARSDGGGDERVSRPRFHAIGDQAMAIWRGCSRPPPGPAATMRFVQNAYRSAEFAFVMLVPE